MAIPVRDAFKSLVDAACLVIVAPAAAMAVLEARWRAHSERVFTFWGQAFALIPGVPGIFVRRAYYRLTLQQCASRFAVGFGTFFSHRGVVIENDVYIGAYSIVGSSILRKGCSIGSRCSIISGSRLHVRERDGHWTPSDLGRLEQIDIGEHALIGEGCLVMANVGRSALVAAGAVVSGRVAPGVVVAGNPARFVRSLDNEPAEEWTPTARSSGA
jgi:acetyltransferase-like isoleucine patch superfamily enzyme